MRRLLNFSLALIALVVSLPLLPFIVLAVKLGSPGPVLYRQQRVDGAGKVSTVTSSAPCARTRKPIRARLGLPTTIRELRRWEISADLAAR